MPHLSAPRRAAPLLLALLATTALAACATGTAEPAADADTAKPHGYVEGASEMPEPQSRLVYSDAAGDVRLLDLLSEADKPLASVGPITGTSSDGRFTFAPGADGVSVIDAGAWTVDHGDHMHYYLAEARSVGTVDGAGAEAVASSATRTAVFFADDGEAVILDRDALGTDDVVELTRFETAPHDGVVVPFADGFLATMPGADGIADRVALLDADGAPVDGVEAACPAVGGERQTRVGVVFSCADGALLATETDGEVAFEHVAYPEGAATRAGALDNRAGRPAVGAVAGDAGAWQFDSRAREWTFIATDTPLVAVSAVGDDEHLLVAVDTTGRVLVLSAPDAAVIAASEPLLASSAAERPAEIGLVVDASRAYVSGPAESVILEIDYRDGARVARSFATPVAPIGLELAG
ncbi:ABC transporter [Agromyces atrinae]|uniref:ABC transporter n=1 Tax=Agromyces atrinae TaxID=592376 RepID=UPI001F580AA6|nr:ABC transporter [Agromyces atrinae]MCI2956423.1 ABC transporter [Agromyces atrinae]